MRSSEAMERKYKLFKNKNGTWFQDADERVQITDATTIAIKKAIEQKENIST